MQFGVAKAPRFGTWPSPSGVVTGDAQIMLSHGGKLVVGLRAEHLRSRTPNQVGI